MARYTGPKVKISRRLGVNIFENEKGRKALEKRPYPPGEHGRSRRRQPSEYSIQLLEKQKAKYIYGVLEKQFENLYKEATRQRGVTGEHLLRMLEQRLDIASARVRKGDVVTLSPKAAHMIVVQHNIDVLDRKLVGWLESGDGGKQVTVRDLPQREHIDVPVRESLIVELYSK
jgi:small subunit ribosomal protein S4